MSTDFVQFKLPLSLSLLLLVIFSVTSSVHCLNSRELDETTVPSTTNPPGQEKCSPACENPAPPPPTPAAPPPPAPCPPPPALPPPSPPPPALPPPSPPPPSPKKPPSQYCPPPPPSSYIYITGPPGQLYPIDSDLSGAGPSDHLFTSLSVLTGCGCVLLSLLALW